jgi:hypothetical protein
MKASAETIWQVPAYLPYLQPPLTDAAVTSAEERIGYKLPTEYLDALRKQNGGYIRYSLPKMVHDTICGIGPHFPSLTEFDWEEVQDEVSFKLQGLVPFDGDGHWHLCFDYRRNSKAPTITYVDIECDRQSPVADSFANYLAKLQVDVGEERVIQGVPGIEDVVSGLSAALGIEFEPPDADAYGYVTYRASLGTEDDPQWLWISPNTVPRGFVRRDDVRFAELKDLMPGNALRFPEAPGQACILSATDAVRAKIIEACSRTGMAARPLRDYVRGG